MNDDQCAEMRMAINVRKIPWAYAKRTSDADGRRHQTSGNKLPMTKIQEDVAVIPRTL